MTSWSRISNKVSSVYASWGYELLTLEPTHTSLRKLATTWFITQRKTVVTPGEDQLKTRSFPNTTLEVESPEADALGPQRAALVVDLLPHKDWKPPSCLLFQKFPQQ